MIWKAYLSAKDIQEVFCCCQAVAYRIMDAIMEAKDKDGNLVVDPERMPPFQKRMVPRECAIKVYPNIRKSFIKLQDVEKTKNGTS